MKLTDTMKQRLAEVAEELFFDYEVVAIRVQEVPFELGAIDHVSSVWEDGEETDEELDGICAIRAKDVDKSDTYFGDHVAIIAGNRYTYGEDIGEVIIEDAEVVEILA